MHPIDASEDRAAFDRRVKCAAIALMSHGIKPGSDRIAVMIEDRRRSRIENALARLVWDGQLAIPIGTLRVIRGREKVDLSPKAAIPEHRRLRLKIEAIERGLRIGLCIPLA